ncbi:MAG: M15 family metallopeptidase [Candidatus Microsaccharimonas sp.]
MPPGFTNTAEETTLIDPELVDSIVAKTDQLRDEDAAGVRIMSRRAFASILTKPERRLVKRLYRLSPQCVGIAMDEWTKTPDPDESEFALIPATVHAIGDTQRVIQAQYVPSVAYDAFRDMQGAMRHDGLGILSGSSYRSPAYQAGIFLTHIRRFDYSFDEALKTVALPMNSEHSDLVRPAFDVIAKSIPAEHHSYDDFERTPEYSWMVAHAAIFGFALSYPEGNDTGLVFEPWHWRFVGR